MELYDKALFWALPKIVIFPVWPSGLKPGSHLVDGAARAVRAAGLAVF